MCRRRIQNKRFQPTLILQSEKCENIGAFIFQKNCSVPWVAGYSATLALVEAGVGVDTGAQPLTVALVPGVQDVHHLVTAHAQRAAVWLARDVEVDPYVEGVARSQCAIH